MKAILKPVSRSFYLTIQFLPQPLREPVGLAYLLARATDTIADTAIVPAADRLRTLRDLSRVIQGELEAQAIESELRAFASQQSDESERRLIQNLRSCLEWLARLGPDDRANIQQVMGTIVKGQTLDVQRFADKSTVTSLQTAAELDEYTYLVAGCVGEFWTKLGFRRLPPFSIRSRDEMATLGVSYGKGLQLINVLRDRNADLRNRRDYLPANELTSEPLEKVFCRWLDKAEKEISAGIDYCELLTNWRVRYATALPALIGARTIALLRHAGPSAERAKVSRNTVRQILLHGLTASLRPRALRPLFDRLRTYTR